MSEADGKSKALKAELRITGKRDAPSDLPQLLAKDFGDGIWAAVKQPAWYISDAAHYVHGQLPGSKMSTSQQKDVERTRFWLRKELAKAAGQSVEWADTQEFTPGDIMRCLWDGYRNFSLKVWSLYRHVDMGEITFVIDAAILKARYKAAAEVVWQKFEKASVDEVVELLGVLPIEAKSASGEPLFSYRAPSTIADFIRDQARLTKGHRSKKLNLMDVKDELIADIVIAVG